MLINATVFLSTDRSYRLVWLNGRFGSGKTSLAYRMAQPFLDEGYRLVSNNNCIWSDDPEKVELLDTGMLRCVVVLDEGGLWFKAGKQIEMIASYAAKMDVIYLLPSFWPPTKSAQVLVVQPLFNFKSAGLPIVVYKWRVKLGSFDESGYFLWVNPKEIYGIYSRQDPGDSGAGIVDWLIRRTDQYRQRFGRGGTNSLSAMEDITEADILTDAVASLGQTVDQWAAIPVRKSGRR